MGLKVLRPGVLKMNDKQLVATLVGGLVFAVAGGLLLILLIQAAVVLFGGHVDAGDDGWGILWLILMMLSGATGLVISAKWARKRYGDFKT
ncbi:MAG: hypothetical protein DMG35_21735 [Acidobacteria bacterium]|nr:MAG: hypothetical protein DMG35_21735 [Acidobacteriota bacterium]